MPIKETPCTLCRGTGEFKGKYITDCAECQGTGFMWVRSGDNDKTILKENKDELRL